MKKIIQAILAVFLLTACGQSLQGNSSANNKPEETAAAEPAAEEPAEDLTSDQILDVVLNDLNLSAAQLQDIKISAPDREGNVTVSFLIGEEAASYVIDQKTGDIIRADLPEGFEKENTASVPNPMEQAINAAFATLDGYKGGAENITVSQQGVNIIVEFDWNGDHYVKTYDTALDRIID